MGEGLSRGDRPPRGHGRPSFVQEKKSLKFTSNDDVVEVDIDFVRESERDRAE